MTLSAALKGEKDKLSNCVHCGFCLPACPTYERLGDEADSPRGRLYLMAAVVEGRLDPGTDAFQDHLDRCLGCRACEPVCPSGVEYGHLLERAREAAAEARRPPLLARALPAVMGGRVLAPVVMLLSRIIRWTRLPAVAARLLPGRGIAGRLRFAAAMLAASSSRPLERLVDRKGTGATGATGAVAEGEHVHRDGAPVPDASERTRKPSGEGLRVGLLRGCVQEGLFAGVNRATERVLSANGHAVVAVTNQGCCGALHAHGGALERARELARRNVDAFEALELDRVVVNAAGCGAAMKEYGALLEEDGAWAERARSFADRCVDVSEILVEGGIRRGGPLPLRVAYDPPCHLLHAQGVADPPLALLRSIPGLEPVPVSDAGECCGGAGIYGITHPELGGWIGGDKVRAVAESGAEVLATGNPGCMMQIGAGSMIAGHDVVVAHPVELLDESYRRGGLYERTGPAETRESP